MSGTDPRNTAWANNKSRFGYNMLVKMGWKEDKGLGQNEDGIKSHIKVTIRKDNKGIGADRKVNGELEWKKGTEGLSNVLARLSRSATPPPQGKQLNFVAAKETSISGSLSDSEKDKAEMKRKRSADEEEKKEEEGIEEPETKKHKKDAPAPAPAAVATGSRPGRMLNMKNVKAKTRELSKEEMACIFGDFVVKRDEKKNEEVDKEDTKKKEKEEKDKKKKEEKEKEEEVTNTFKTTVSTVSSKDYFKEKMKQKKMSASANK